MEIYRVRRTKWTLCGREASSVRFRNLSKSIEEEASHFGGYVVRLKLRRSFCHTLELFNASSILLADTRMNTPARWIEGTR